MNFELDESLEWDVIIRREWTPYANKQSVTNEELVEVLKQTGYSYSIGNDDGPEFKALRNQLEADGYIQCERGWWNGDRVLKPFLLNGVKFEKGSQYPSGAAMKYHLQSARKYALLDNPT
jgi:hypothetical protein